MKTGSRLWLLGLALASMLLGLSGCGGGGGDGGSPGTPPLILGSLVSFPSGAAPSGALPPGTNTAVVVAVLDPDTGAPLTSATVTVNGTHLSYAAALQGYEGAVTIDAGGPVAVSVTVDGATYALAGAQFNAYPTITAPASGAVWSSQSTNLVAWSGVAPSSSALYALGVLDPNGNWVWPADGNVQIVSPPTTSFSIDAGSLGIGARLVMVGVVTALPVPSANPNSAIVIGGFNVAPITVTSAPTASLVSIAISPVRPTLSKGGSLQLTATGTYSDGSTQDLTAQVSWATTAPAVATVSASGLARGVNFGSTTVSAALGGVATSEPLVVFEPTPSPPPPLSQAVAYQIDYAHSGRAVFGTPITFPSSPTWSINLPGTVSYPLIADGKVFVTTNNTSPGNLYGTQLIALDAQTGATAWGPVFVPGTYYRSGHAYDHGRLFVINFDGLLRGFDAGTGQALWSTQLPGGQYWFDSPPTAVNGIVYVGGSGSGGTLYAVDESNGNVLWTASVNGGQQSSPAVSADGVFVSYPCQVYKFDPLSGVALWHYAGPCSGGGGRTPAYANGQLFVRDWTNSTSQIFDAAIGTLVGSFSAGPIPALGVQTGYFLDAGTLRAIDLTSRASAWTFTGDGQLVSAPIVVDGYVLVGSTLGNVYAINAATGVQVWVGSAAGPIAAPDEQSVAAPLSGLGAGEGLLVVPAGGTLTAWRLTGP